MVEARFSDACAMAGDYNHLKTIQPSLRICEDKMEDKVRELQL